MSRPFYSDAKTAKNVSYFFFLFVTFYFHVISQELLQIQTGLINTPLEKLRHTDVPFWGYKSETKDLGGRFGRKIDFWL